MGGLIGNSQQHLSVDMYRFNTDTMAWEAFTGSVSGGDDNALVLITEVDVSGVVTNAAILTGSSGYSTEREAATTGGSGSDLTINVLDVYEFTFYRDVYLKSEQLLGLVGLGVKTTQRQEITAFIMKGQYAELISTVTGDATATLKYQGEILFNE